MGSPGIHAEGRETYFCLTTSPGAFPGFEHDGARARAAEIHEDSLPSIASTRKRPARYLEPSR
jgi:hypothetical protein